MEDELFKSGTPKGTRKEKGAGFWQKNKAKRKDEQVKGTIQNYMRKRERQEIDNTRFELLPMCGYQVKLPMGIQPYPTQKLMIVKILTALNGRQNVLAESPTGSGKTLALLAATCAWMVDYRQKRDESRRTCVLHQNGGGGPESQLPVVEEEVLELPSEPLAKIPNPTNWAEAFGTPKTYFEEELQSDFTPCRDSPAPTLPPQSLQKAPVKAAPPPVTCTCLPRARIYYSTRTHKQIGQVVKEFRRLPYAGILRHTIMASRDQSCINEDAKRAGDTTAYCKELISGDGRGCHFKTEIRSHRLDVPQLMRKHVETHTETIFDIEDLVDAMKVSSPKICPYFATTRILTSDSDIIFTPFTYLVDPIIRNSSDVVLKNSVVILDEAHNIEDTCREGASFKFEEKEVVDALYAFRIKEHLVTDKLKGIGKQGLQFEDKENDFLDVLSEYSKHMAKLVTLVEGIYEWMKEVALPVKKVNPDKFTGARVENKGWAFLADSLTQKNRKLIFPKGSPEYEALNKALGAVAQQGQGEDDKNQKLGDFKPPGPAIVMVEKWLYFMSFFSDVNDRSTYRMNITMEKANSYGAGATQSYRETKFTGQGPKNIMYSQAEWIWMDSTTGPHGIPPLMEGHRTSISLWCMSPALTFMDAFSEVRSIILASGTLCPMGTLKTELGTQFKFEVEGKQVIPNERIYASVIKVGPSNVSLNLTQSRMSANPKMMYEIVDIIKSICLTVPKGVLCFVPSYKMLSEIMDLMRTTPIGHEIGRRKVILEEPKRSADLNAVMNDFEDVMRKPQMRGPAIDGVLMLAVFRGKISEGIDFADDKARVVISLGIPFPNFGDSQVKEKRRYNDENARTKGILTGDNWYTTQAYRALNQALGRCLRHKNDWGALVLIDERLVSQATNSRYGKAGNAAAPSAQVSRWIRDQLQVCEDFAGFRSGLASFVARMTENVKRPTPRPPIQID